LLFLHRKHHDIYVKNIFDFTKIDFDKPSDIDMEIAGVTFKIPGYDKIALVSVYLAPSQKITTNHLKKLLICKNLIIMGDFNAKHTLWGSKVSDFRGKIIENFIDDNNLICLNKGEGTRLNYNGTFSHIDLALCSSPLGSHLNCDRIDDSWGSDHFPLEVKFEINTAKFLQRQINRFNYEKANWPLFKDTLNHDCKGSEYTVNVETVYNNLVTSFYNARDASIPLKKGNFKHKYSPFWNDECSKAKKKTKKQLKNY